MDMTDVVHIVLWAAYLMAFHVLFVCWVLGFFVVFFLGRRMLYHPLQLSLTVNNLWPDLHPKKGLVLHHYYHNEIEV